MTRIVRVALTETCNAYPDMPATRAELPALADRLEAIRAANVAHHVELARTAAGLGAKLVGFGELFTAPYFALEREPMWLALAEDALTGPTVSTLRQAARELGVILVAPIFEHDGATGRRFNTAVVIDEHGEVLGKYRKTHIPAGTNEQASFCETFYYGPATATSAPGRRTSRAIRSSRCSRRRSAGSGSRSATTATSRA